MFAPTFAREQFEPYVLYGVDRIAKFAFAQHLKAQKAIGKPLKVRIGRATSAEGVIKKAAYFRMRERGKSLVVMFAVELVTTMGTVLRLEVGKLPR
jgi:hypothetical protein